MIAINTIRDLPHYRKAAFSAGLEKLGYKIVGNAKPKSKEDVLLLWNLHGSNEAMGRDWESNGGTVLVCENGFIGHDDQGRQLYAIAVHAHNGAGWWPVGYDDRFGKLGIELKPWQDNLSGHILICGQRMIGSKAMASPPQFEEKTAKQFAPMGYKNIKIRKHPGLLKPATTLEQDLEGARVCVIWSSASGVKALTLGIPVVFCAPNWICAGAAGKIVAAPLRDDAARREALHRMAFAQWTVDEIAAGIPFARIMAEIGDAKW